MSILTKEDIWAKYQLSVYRQLQRLIATQSTNIGDVISTDGQNLIWSVGGGGGTWGSITGTLSAQTDLQNALNAKEDTANKAVAGGYASLDGTGKVPAGQLPSYVDDVIEYANFAALPVTGSTGIIYVTIDNNKTYRWTGSAYTEISANTPAGSNTEIQFNNSGAFGASSNLTWSGTVLGVIGSVQGNSFATPSGGFITTDFINPASSSGLVLRGTNASGGGISFGTLANVTLTSGNLNYLKQTGTFAPTSGTATLNTIAISTTINQTGGANGITRGIYLNPTLTSAADYRSIESTQGQVKLADTYSAGSGSLAGSLLDLSQTWNTTGAPTAIKLNVTDTASNASSLLMDLQVGGVSKFKVSKSGLSVSTGGHELSSASLFYWTSRSIITSPVDGILRITNNLQNDFNRLQFGGTSSAFPSIKRNGAGLDFRLADDSNYAAITAQNLILSDTVLAGSGSLAGSALDIAQTWNTTGAPIGIKFNVINTASGAASLLMDLQVGGVTKFQVDKGGGLNIGAGNILLGNSNKITNIGAGGTALSVVGNGATAKGLLVYNNNVSNTNSIQEWLANDGTTLWASVNNIGQFRLGVASVASSPTLSATGTWFTGGTATTTKPHWLIEPTGTTSTAWSTDGTGLGVNAATGFVGNLIDAQLNGSSKFSVSSAGAVAANSVVAVSSVTAGVGSFLRWGGSSIMTAPSDGVIKMSNAALSDFSRLQFGGTTSSFPSLKRSTTGIIVRLADDSADTDITAAKVISTDVVRLKGYTVATLPGSPTQGDTVFCTDLTTPTYMAVAVGGGAVVGKVFWNGTNWIT